MEDALDWFKCIKEKNFHRFVLLESCIKIFNECKTVIKYAQKSLHSKGDQAWLKTYLNQYLMN